MQRGRSWLSEDAMALALAAERAGPHTDALPTFDVVVIGSGYGGAVAAARLSALAEAPGRERMRVAVLERGAEYTPGSFPDRFSDLVGHLRMQGANPLGAPANPEGLFDWHLDGDVGALVANGLGGGSLINAGVCEPAQAKVLAHKDWPEPWLGNQPLWEALYTRARSALGARPWPERRVDKQAAMAELATRLGARPQPVWLAIAPPKDADPGGQGCQGGEGELPLAPCVECGDCFTGCNVGAKRTLGHNYLARAHAQGAALYTGATVHSVQRLPRGTDDDDDNAPGVPRWLVRWRPTDPLRLPAGQQLFEVRARHVVIAAGTYGSTEILMRSRDAGLAVSGRLGDGFSANGDVLSATHDTGRAVGISPDENQPLAERRAGPTITTQLHWPAGQADAHLAPLHTLQDLTVPGALGWVFAEVLTSMMVPQRWTRWNFATERPGDPDRYAVDPDAIGRSLLTVAYVDDSAAGRLEPGAGWAAASRDGALRVRWKGVGDQAPFLAMDAMLKAATPPGADHLRNPLWQFMPEREYLGLGQTDRRLFTVHPLGGCRMAVNARDGVVDPWGRVFDCGGLPANLADPRTEADRTARSGQHDRSVHPGLAVLDGSIVPTALGINPLLTITALAEGAIDHWQQQARWVEVRRADSDPKRRPAIALPTVPAARPKPEPTAVRFSEVMSGKLQYGDQVRGRQRLRMQALFDPVPDLQAFLTKPREPVRLTGRFALTDTEGKLLTDGQCPELRGTVDWFATERSCVGQRFWRVVRNFVHSRLEADRAEARHKGRSLFEGLGSKLRGATHFGAIRQLAYHFNGVPEGWLGLPKGYTTLRGTKRVGYRLSTPSDPESANPWRQLGEMTLYAHSKHGPRIRLGTLELEEMAALDRHGLPLAMLQQDNAVAALRDLTRLGLYFGRVMFGLHMFSFRRAEYPAEINGPRGLQRLPPLAYPASDPRFDGLRVERHTVDVPQKPGEPPLTLLLTHLCGAGKTTGLPVLLVHGFGSGGVQFTHPVIPQPMAPWLARQGHDVWVGELRTSIGLDSHRRQWSMDLIARQDIPALVRAVCDLTQQPKVHVVAHCIGAAMFSMAMLSGRLQAGGTSLIASALLMQVGPRVQLPYASRARAYVAMRLRQLLGAAEAHSVASQDIGDIEALMDRVFGTYLYPWGERPFYRLGHDPSHDAGPDGGDRFLAILARNLVGRNDKRLAVILARNTARVNANRSAVIFGQLFQSANMTPALLAALPDLLGSCNLTTYEQTAQYADEHRLTNQSGEDVYTSPQRLRDFFDIPVTLLHGMKNKTFDPRTLWRNFDEFAAAALRMRVVPVEKFGHLDCVVGQGADSAVFPHIQAHLAGAASQPPVGFQRAVFALECEARLPRVGPWLGDVQPADGGLLLRIGLRLDEPGRPAPLKGIATLLCDAQRRPLCADYTPHPCTPDQHEQVLEMHLPWPLPDAAANASTGDADGPLRLLVAVIHGAWPASAQALVQAVGERCDVLRDIANGQLTPLIATEGLLLDRGWLQRIARPRADRLGLALGACRQRPLLADRDLADAAMGALVAAVDGTAPTAHAPIDLVLLAGDQVYADTRADTGHTSAQRRQYFEAHQEAWSAPNQRELLRRRPVVMALDDHEFRNDYNNRISDGRPEEFHAAATAWQRYQLDAGPRQHVPHPALPGQGLKAAWRKFKQGGFAFFVCDTRSERVDTSRVDRHGAQIMSSLQMDALKDWLSDLQRDPAHGHRPKVVVTGSPMAPLFRQAQGNDGQATWSDGWQRFPDSQAELLHWIASQQIQQVLFLSGDYHLHADVQLRLQAPGKTEVRARSIVTGGLYSPYPFANATRDEWLDGDDAQDLRAGATTWGYTITDSKPGSGYTRLTLGADGQVQADFVAVLAPAA